jgi:hypothetical protein
MVNIVVRFHTSRGNSAVGYPTRGHPGLALSLRTILQSPNQGYLGPFVLEWASPDL